MSLQCNITLFAILFMIAFVSCNDDIVGCGGFVQSAVPIQFEKVGVKLYTKTGALKLKTECAPNNGYFLVAVYDKGDYVVKIDPPSGWNFEPSEIDLHIDGKTDPCVKGIDLNFKFTGYTVKGVVPSKGRDQGPAGVSMSLKSLSSENSESTTLSVEGGHFTFQNVLPGKYQLQGSHTLWTVDQSPFVFEVTNDNVEVNDKIYVKGYDVTGHVLSGDQPIKGVIFVLFATPSLKGTADRCDPVTNDLLSKLTHKFDDLVPICRMSSGEDGFFLFPSIASGVYTLVPHYSSQHITFDVVPSKVVFNVNYKSVVLQTPFQVHGFSVSGKVINSDGKAISNVTVQLSGESTKIGVTKPDGTYVVENVTIGHYKLSAMAENIFFEESDVYVTPNTPHLPDVKASKYNVCGLISVISLPSGSLPLSQRKVMMLKVGSQNSDMTTQNVDANGNFCFKATPGSYKVEALVGPGEQKVGFILSPKDVVVSVSTSPVLNVHFKQFLASINGKLLCVDSCDNATVTLSKPQASDKVTADITYNGKEASFVFNNVLPGKYKLAPSREKWCWEPRMLEIEVQDEDLKDLKLNHVGYILKCVLSHDIKLNFTIEGVNETVGSFSLSKGSNKFCLKEAGVYHLVPWSCYKFNQNVYMYDTNKPTTLTLSVATYKVVMEVTVPKVLSDLSLVVNSLTTDAEEVVKPDLITPLTKETKAADNATKEEVAIPKKFIYSAIFWGKLGEDLKISAQSNEVLFNPESVTVKVADSCPAAKIELAGKEGVFVAGKVTPPIADVLISVVSIVTEKYPQSMTYTALTKADGTYSIGPLHDDVKFGVTAARSGYVVKLDHQSKVDFIAEKLSEIKVQIIDTLGNPMSGVLLSLSGGQFRSNSLTPENGELSFIDLAPGSYYVRPMQKEFSFQPSAQLVDVEEGAVSTLQIRGVRVAFSCLGSVTTLSRDPERQIIVEAVGLDDCKEYQEESATDNDGKYRLRGLHPKCQYTVRLQQKADEEDSHISRTAPYNHTINIADQDIMDLNFIAFHKPKSFELTAFIETDQSNLNHIKILLFKEDNFDSPIHTISPTVLNHIFFPALPLGKATYVVRIDSNLAQKTHEIKSTSITFSTDGLYKKHIILKFSAEKKRLDIEPTQSVIALPFAVALVLVAYNYDTAIPFLLKLYDTVRGKLDNNVENQQDSGDESKTKKKKR